MLIISTIIACVGGLLFGFDTGIIAGVMPELRQAWHLTQGQAFGAMSAIMFGAMFGAALAGKIADYIGRRDTIMATAALFVLGSFTSALVNSAEAFIACRLLVGVALGAVSLAAPLYISEISPTRSRARLVICYQVGITSGILLAYVASLYFESLPYGWRGMLVAGAVPGVLLSVGSLLLVESPRWLMLQGDEGEARQAFARLGQRDVDDTIQEIRRSMDAPSGDLWSCLFTTPVRMALLFGVGLFFLQQFVGINAILYSAPTAKAAGSLFPPEAPVSFTLLLGLVNLCMTFVALVLVNRVRRRRLLQVGLAGMACCLALLALVAQWGEAGHGLQWLSFAGLLAYVAFFSATWGPLAWVVVSEIYPLKIRGLAMSIPVASHWLFAMLATAGGDDIAAMAKGSVMYWIFFAMALLGLLFLRRERLETYGLSLEAIQDHLLSRPMPSARGELIYYAIATVAATGGLLIGLNIGVISGALVLITPQWHLSSFEQGLLVSSVSAGLLVGQLLAGRAADLFGRRYLLLSTAALYVAGAFACALAHSLPVLTGARFVVGVTMGVTAVANAMYLSEIAPTAIRGKLLTLNQLCLCLGLLLAYLAAVVFESAEHGWRYMFGVMALPAAVYGCCLLFLPESPRWLLSRGARGACARMLARMGEKDVEQTMASLQGDEEEPGEGGLRQLFAPWLVRPVLLGVLLMFLSVFTGFDALVFYAPTIFKGAGFASNTASFMATFGLGMVNLAMTAVSMGTVDRSGRKTLLLVGMAVMVLALGTAGMSALFTGTGQAQGGWAVWLLLGALCLFVGAFALSLGPVTGVVVSEIYPQRVRGTALGLVYAANSLFTFVFTLGFPTLLQTLGYPLTFWLFSATGVVGGLLCWKFLPETKGLSLEEIERYWKQGRLA